MQRRLSATTAPTVGSVDVEDPLPEAADPVEVAREHVAQQALEPCVGGRVGLELEQHLVDLDQPGRRPTWEEARALATSVGTLPAGSSVTLEPGGQIELSTPPGVDVVAAVAALRLDQSVLRTRLRAQGYGVAAIGCDPARAVERVSPGPRYVAMEQHFEAMGCGGPGMAMMSGTAALQVNLDAGPAVGWRDRLALLAALVPVLVAASASSPYLAGRSTGWHSTRQWTWTGIDPGRSGQVPAGDPTEAWADYALAAPVMLVSDEGVLRPVTRRVTFGQWLAGRPLFGRTPTLADLDYHLTTLFPPVRPRGYLEIRCIDALPDRWWPAMAAITATLADDPGAADEAAELCEGLGGRAESAARIGAEDTVVARAMAGCVAVAARRCPEALRPEVEDFAELLAAGRTPSGELRARMDTTSPSAVLLEEAHA